MSQDTKERRIQLHRASDGSMKTSQEMWIDSFYALVKDFKPSVADEEISKTVKAMYKEEDLKTLYFDENDGSFMRLEHWIDGLSGNSQAIKKLLAGTLLKPINKYFPCV
jgi:hypothetical protein